MQVFKILSNTLSIRGFYDSHCSTTYHGLTKPLAFKIPILVFSKSTCNADINSSISETFKKTSLFI